MTTQEILCRWFEQKEFSDPRHWHHGHTVFRVEIEEDYDPGWSEMTPGEGAYTDVLAYNESDEVMGSVHYTDNRELILEICNYAVSRIQP